MFQTTQAVEGLTLGAILEAEPVLLMFELAMAVGAPTKAVLGCSVIQTLLTTTSAGCHGTPQMTTRLKPSSSEACLPWSLPLKAW